MKEITAYEATDGTIHKTRESAARASLLHLGEIDNSDSRGKSIGEAEVAFIVKNRKKVIDILNEIEFVPEYAKAC